MSRKSDRSWPDPFSAGWLHKPCSEPVVGTECLTLISTKPPNVLPKSKHGKVKLSAQAMF